MQTVMSGQGSTPQALNLPTPSLTTLALLFALSIRPLALASTLPTASSAESKAADAKGAAKMDTGSDDASDSRHGMATLLKSCFASFATQILSIPLLLARLRAANLLKLSTSFVSPQVWIPVTTAIAEQHLLALPHSSSHSWFDSTVTAPAAAAAPAAASSAAVSTGLGLGGERKSVAAPAEERKTVVTASETKLESKGDSKGDSKGETAAAKAKFVVAMEEEDDETDRLLEQRRRDHSSAQQWYNTTGW